jgi:hypothetical protein
LEKAKSALVGLSLGEEDVVILAKDLDEEIEQQADLFGV